MTTFESRLEFRPRDGILRVVTADRPPLAASRLGLVIAFAILVAIAVYALVPQQAAIITSMAITEGAPLVAWLLAGLGIGSIIVRAGPSSVRNRGEGAPALMLVTRLATGLGIISLLTLLLGVSGFLSQRTAIPLIAVGDLLAIRHIYNHRMGLQGWLRDRAGAAWLLLLAAPVFAILLVGDCVLPGVLWGLDDPSGYDVAAYHLQLPREWYELGRVTTLDHNVFSFFPLNVEIHSLLAMHLHGGPWAGMYLAQLMHGSFVGLTIAAVYAAARRRGRLAATVAAIFCASVPWMFMLGSVAYVEGGLMLYATLAAAWAMRGRWAIAGACAGLACGCKLTGVPLSILIAVFSPFSLWERARVRAAGNPSDVRATSCPHPSPLPEGEGVVGRRSESLRGVLVLALTALVVFSPWLIRTAIASGGNPIFPLGLRTLGHGHFDPGQIERFEAAHSPREDQRSLNGRVAALWQQVGGDYHYGSIAAGNAALPLWLLLVVPATFLAWHDREARVCLLLILGSVLIWLFATHLQGRFLVHMIPFAAMLIACAIGATDEYAHPCRCSPDDQKARMRVLIRGTFAVVVMIVAIVSLIGSARAPIATLLRVPADAFGVTEPAQLRGLLPNDRVAAAVYDSDRPIGLLGDAKAFWYAIPSTRLHYRSVFDVRSTGFREGWLGPEVPANALVIPDFNELTRFYRTYRRLPKGYDTWNVRSLGPVIRVADVPE